MARTLTPTQQRFINEILLPELHRHLDVLLPHLFDANHGKWDEARRAWKSKYHLDNGDYDGTYTTWAPTRINGKSTYHLLYDFGHGGVPREIINEIANRNYNGMRGRAIEQLSDEYGLTSKYEEMYRRELTPEQKARIEKEDQLACDLSIARDTFIKALWSDSNDARQALDYMRARGWSDEDIKAGQIGLINKETRLQVSSATGKRLESRWNEAIGNTHTIAIPLHANGAMHAFQFRTIDKAHEDIKYQYEYISKTKVYGYISNCNIVVCEGTLDYAHAIAKGFPNIVTTGGNPSNEQISYLLRYATSAQTCTMFFDDDPGGRKHINKLCTALINDGKKGIIRIAYTEPIEGSSPKDIDEWIGIINAKGLNALDMYNKSIANAIVYDEWKPLDIELTFAEGILLKDEDKKKRNRGLSHITDDMIASIGQVVTKEQARALRQGMKDFFMQCDKEYIESARAHWERWEIVIGCSIASLITTKSEIEQKRKREDTRRNIKQLYGAMMDGDDIAIRECTEKLYTITDPNTITDDEEWEKYGAQAVTDYTSAEMIENDLGTEKKGIPTCITFTDGTLEHYAPMLLEPGLTFLCANTGHGKTSILNRIVIDEATRNRKLGTDEGVMYFSFEIDRRALIRDLLCIYANDPAMGKSNPRKAMITYFTEHSDKDFNKGEYATGITHYQHFLSAKDDFFEHYIKRDGYINIINDTLSYENILKIVESYIKSAKRRRENGLGKDISIIAIDYAQLLYTDKDMIRTEQISTICKGLNELGQKYQIPIVMPAQFNQSVLSPHHMDIRCIGEGGGFSRYSIAVYGFFALNFLYNAGEKSDKENLEILRKMGIDINDSVIRPINNIIYAKCLKARNNEWVPCETLLYWNYKLKTIEGNTNPYIAHPELARKDGMSIEKAIKEGREGQKATAKKMGKAIEQPFIKAVKPDEIMRTLSADILKDEDDITRHPEYSSEPIQPSMMSEAPAPASSPSPASSATQSNMPNENEEGIIDRYTPEYISDVDIWERLLDPNFEQDETPF